MTDGRTKSQKAAATTKQKRPKFFQEIGAIGGTKTPGTFKTKRGLAKKAGQRSGQVRKLKGMKKRLAELHGDLKKAADNTDQQKILERITRLDLEIINFERELDGRHAVEGLEYEQ